MIENRESESYCFVVRGFAPELMRGVAFRREKHYRTRDRKAIKCPYCGNDFETVDNDVKVEIRCFKRKSEALAHNAIACRICHNPVGIIFASA